MKKSLMALVAGAFAASRRYRRGLLGVPNNKESGSSLFTCFDWCWLAPRAPHFADSYFVVRFFQA